MKALSFFRPAAEAVAWLAFCIAIVGSGIAADPPRVALVAAENFYGDVAKQLGGDRVDVASILSNPDSDPHLFETTPSVIRRLRAAQIVVVNGAGYDSWVAPLLSGERQGPQRVITVADLVHKHLGDNPHLWYDPATMPALAAALTEALASIDPEHATEYRSRFTQFSAVMANLSRSIAEIRGKYAGMTVATTEPVFDYMAAALGLQVRDHGFALATMNGTEPSARQIAALEDDLRQRRVKALLYNKQTTNEMTRRLLTIAGAANVPVVGVTETEPAGLSYQDWMLGQLDEIRKALGASSS